MLQLEFFISEIPSVEKNGFGKSDGAQTRSNRGRKRDPDKGKWFCIRLSPEQEHFLRTKVQAVSMSDKIAEVIRHSMKFGPGGIDGEGDCPRDTAGRFIPRGGHSAKKGKQKDG